MFQYGKTKPNIPWPHLIILMVIMSFPTSVKSQNISLTDAIAYGIQHNEEILRQKEVVFQKQYEHAAMKGNFLPKITAAGGYTYLSENMQINMEQVKGSLDDVLSKYGVAVANEIIPIETSPEFQQGLYNSINSSLSKLPAYNIEIDNQHMPTANIVATQPIFMGGKIIAGTKFAKAESNEASYELIKVSNEVTQTIIKRYLAVVLLQDVVETRANVLEGMKEHRNEAEKAIEIGVVPPHVLLRADVAVADAKRKMKDDENNLQLALLALKSEMGMKEDTVLVISDKMKYHMNAIALDSSLQDAYEAQPIFGILEQKRIMVRQNYNVKRSEILPKVVAWGEYGFFREELPIIQPPVMLGIQVKMNLFNGLKNINEMKAAKHLEMEVDYAEDYARNQIKLWVNKSYINILNSQSKYQEMQAVIAMAEENLRVNEKRFTEGLTASLDVLDARLLLEGELVEELVSLYDYYNALADFYTATAQPEKILEIFNQN
ncbi:MULTISPECIES: TolC family protein [unclassified Lentimicrobium]|uniref:TolC family protein n=1 Tax=unclassified Lentimicrobium TaxID=2677434 RepID=UPI001551B86F|nr:MULTISPECIES: TolC family protein [unclassified Lentimicrobium]NPD46661.1 TolC family protein [Lentimicrobium sp. S6]NPD85486.1 TolC family protein [Lentimicrobium sp. L6]